MGRQFFLGFISMALLLNSCDWKKSTDALTQEIVEAELKTINWNELDQFPLFDACDETADKSGQQECFQSTLMLHLSMAFQDFELKSASSLNDTIFIDLKVDNQGRLSVLKIIHHEAVLEQNPDFNNLVDTSLERLPKLHPALKRGIPVAAQFRVPLVLQIHE